MISKLGCPEDDNMIGGNMHMCVFHSLTHRLTGISKFGCPTPATAAPTAGLVAGLGM